MPRINAPRARRDSTPWYERLLRVVARTAGLRARVLQVWPGRCAACGLELRDHDHNPECEIAHVRDVHAKGPDLIANCLPLCRSHHWAFDRHLWAIHPTTLKIAIAAGAERRCAAARPGPWTSHVEGRDHWSGSNLIMVGNNDESRGEDIELTGATIDVQDFLAHARQDVPRLLAEVRRLRAN